MNVVFTPSAWSDYLWLQENDRRLLKRVNLLIQDASREPHSGIGKPEPLKANLTGYWSRRIDERHRLVYEATDEALIIIACRYHYGE